MMIHNTETRDQSEDGVVDANHDGDDAAVDPLVVDRPQPAWRTLDAARERSFTGELVFAGDPEVRAYLDQGIVYYAERSTDAPLGQRLLTAHLVDAEQLERGTVRVGEVEHLGRLFERDTSVDRDAVLVATEAATEELIAELANDAVTTARATAYRHHPSGVHRWFVGPTEPNPVRQPMGPVAPLGPFDLGELGDVTASSPDDDILGELTIEWDEPFDGADDVEILSAVGGDDRLFDELVLDLDPVERPPSTRDDTDRIEPGPDGTDELLLVVEDDVQTAAPASPETPSLDMSDFVDLDTAEGDDEHQDLVDARQDRGDDEPFEMIWPNGSVEVADGEREHEPERPDAVADDEEPGGEGVSAAGAGAIHFDLPDLTVPADDDVPSEEVSDDVADAVRRALAAIENATLPTPAPEPATGDSTADAADPAGSAASTAEPAPEALGHDAHGGDAEPVESARPPAAFAPPTLDTSAEAIYARAAAAAPSPSLPEAGKASVVFVDDDEQSADSSEERTSALKRLIRSLGRKDR